MNDHTGIVTSERESNRPTDLLSPSPARLVCLELHGYKSFALKTEFVFPTGITAIVGPNGSGKSNIADALRWVLGEQSYSVLRGKRTEDMIFSGSEQRPRMGMASVSVTFNNSDGWLPVDYSTVVLTRRAYRSGENEYFLNGTRVRLRDIQELLAESGLLKRSYAIIGQGLVDQALSLRPEERRVLIEEAAGITAYQRKRDQALTRLAEVEANLVRVQDIMAELSPQLRRLQKQAEKVEQYTLLKDQLRSLLITWYGYRWHQGVEELARAETAYREQEQRLTARRQRLRELEQQHQTLEEEHARWRTQLQEHHRQISELHQQLEALLREEAVIAERKRGLEAQRSRLQNELPALMTHREALEQRLADVRNQQQRLSEEAATLATELEAVQAQVAAWERQYQEAEQRVRELQEQLLHLTAQIAQRQEQQRQVDARLQTLEEEINRQQAQLQELQSQHHAVDTRWQAHRQRMSQKEQALAELRAALEAQEHVIQQRQEAFLEAQARLRQAEDALATLKKRQQTLEWEREEGRGLYAGVRAVLQARELSGIIGIVAELIQVPDHLERAIEEALGPSLQDIVVERWRDAEAAVTFLKQKQAGRATFLPLDSIRPPRRLPVPSRPGVIGLGADLVTAEARLRPVVELLLNRTLVVKDLATARQVLSQADGLRIVTLDGELVRTTGRLTGGTIRRQREGILAREREWRALPQRIAEALDILEQTRAKVTATEQALQAAKGERQALHQQYQNLTRELTALQEKEQRLARERTALAARLETARQVHQRLVGEQQRLQEHRQQLDTDHQELQARHAETKAALANARQALESLRSDDVHQRLTHLQTLQAALTGRQQTLAETARTLEEDLNHQKERIAAQEAQLQQITADIASQEARLRDLQERINTLQERVAALQEPVAIAEKQLTALEEERQRIAQQREQEQQRLHQDESFLARLNLAYQRAQDVLRRLQEDITADLGLVQLEETSDLFPAQEPLPLENGVITLPRVTQLQADVEDEIKRLRIRLRQLEPVNPDAPEEYARLQERYTFLETQVQDLIEASTNLKHVIAELDQTMKREFERTFKAVAKEFKVYFERLFGGGTARLVLTQPDDLTTTGIDIIARPPRKRTQGLAMLSGGERALTAAALIFAILKVSPPPFCVLDEVDAALDEANVGRFRQALRELAQDIQFIVITHNRGTIEAADTIYGISMGQDGVSRALSLRLEEVPASR